MDSQIEAMYWYQEMKQNRSIFWVAILNIGKEDIPP